MAIDKAELAKAARGIAERMRWEAEHPMWRVSSESGPTIFIPFPEFYDNIATALSE